MVNYQIETKNLNLWFGNNHVLHDVNLSITNKKVTAMIGPSGCGKSTLLRSFNRMNDLITETKIAGKVLLDGEDIYHSKTDVTSLRTRVGMVFQKPNPFPKSIYNNVAFGLVVQGKYHKAEIQDRVEKSLKDAWLWEEVKDRLHDSAMSLSGGQQQRLCIAVLWQTIPKSCCLMSRLLPFAHSLQQKLKSFALSSRTKLQFLSLLTTLPRQAEYQTSLPLCIWVN